MGRCGLDLQRLDLPELKGERLVVHVRKRRDARFTRWLAQIRARGHIVPDVRAAVERLRKQAPRFARGVAALIAYAFELATARNADRLAWRLRQWPVCDPFILQRSRKPGTPRVRL